MSQALERGLGTGFQHVDGSTDPEFFVRYLDAVSALEAARKYKQCTIDLLRVGSGDRVLDVGCGTGDDVRLIASQVGSTGLVVGVDNSTTMIAAARQRVRDNRPGLELHVGNAHALNFADGTFDACRADRVFQHLDMPDVALRELARVVRPGGWVVVADPDWDTLVVDAPDRGLTRKIVHHLCDTRRNGQMGRQLPALFGRCGLVDVGIQAFAAPITHFAVAAELLELEMAAQLAQDAGIISAEAGEAWLTQLRQASLEGRFFASLTGFIVAGRKPGAPGEN